MVDDYLWLDAKCDSDIPDRHKLIVLVGPTLLGKTQWARSLGRHIYWKGSINVKNLTTNRDYQYIVIDDIDWQYIPEVIKKNVLLGTGDATVVQKYMAPTDIYQNKPCIFIMNPLDESYDQLGYFFNSGYWAANTVVIKIKHKLF
ncbi:MAG TPA: hypothetical protein VMR18_03000 [Candidatus Saccharimonadales bacterium]|nr:hypothetical protein [Candidatus Saccharimonadales bacterium]